jgi:hypothetical protein
MRYKAGALLTAVLVALGCSVIAAPPASACSCVWLGGGMGVPDYDAAFIGSRIENRPDAGTSSDYPTVVEVEEVLVGEVQRYETLIVSSAPGGGCGVRPDEDEVPTGIVADRRADGYLEISACSFVPEGELRAFFGSPPPEVADQVAAMRSGARLIDDAGPGSVTDAWAPWVIAGLLGLTVAVGALARRERSPRTS